MSQQFSEAFYLWFLVYGGGKMSQQFSEAFYLEDMVRLFAYVKAYHAGELHSRRDAFAKDHPLIQDEAKLTQAINLWAEFSAEFGHGVAIAFEDFWQFLFSLDLRRDLVGMYIDEVLSRQQSREANSQLITPWTDSDVAAADFFYPDDEDLDRERSLQKAKPHVEQIKKELA